MDFYRERKVFHTRRNPKICVESKASRSKKLKDQSATSGPDRMMLHTPSTIRIDDAAPPSTIS